MVVVVVDVVGVDVAVDVAVVAGVTVPVVVWVEVAVVVMQCPSFNDAYRGSEHSAKHLFLYVSCSLTQTGARFVEHSILQMSIVGVDVAVVVGVVVKVVVGVVTRSQLAVNWLP
jgi:hypothetical protein